MFRLSATVALLVAATQAVNLNQEREWKPRWSYTEDEWTARRAERQAALEAAEAEAEEERMDRAARWAEMRAAWEAEQGLQSGEGRDTRPRWAYDEEAWAARRAERQATLESAEAEAEEEERMDRAARWAEKRAAW